MFLKIFEIIWKLILERNLWIVMLLGEIIFGSCLDLIFFNDINVYDILDIVSWFWKK